jgi:hypothetical protein
MKTLIKLFLVFAVAMGALNVALAQTKAEKQTAIKNMVDNKNYVFEANYALPMRGGQKQLTSDYDLRVSKDSIIAYLPYYGRAYMAPVDPTEGGIKFTCTNFSYTTKLRKNGTWDITIKPRDKNITDWRDVQELTMNISPNGYASLQVVSSNRDPISFDGDIRVKN